MAGDNFDRGWADKVLELIDAANSDLQGARRIAEGIGDVAGIGSLPNSGTVRDGLASAGTAYYNALDEAVKILQAMFALAEASFKAVEGTDLETAANLRGGPGAPDGGVTTALDVPRADTFISADIQGEVSQSLSLWDIVGGVSDMEPDRVFDLANSWESVATSVREKMQVFGEDVVKPFDQGWLVSAGFTAMRDSLKTFADSMQTMAGEMSKVQKAVDSLANGITTTKAEVPSMVEVAAWTSTSFAGPLAYWWMEREARSALDMSYNPPVTGTSGAVPEKALRATNPVQGRPDWTTSGVGVPGTGGGGDGFSGGGGGAGGGYGGAGAGAGGGAGSGAGSGAGGVPDMLSGLGGAGGMPEGMDDSLTGAGGMGALGAGGVGAGGGGGGAGAGAAMRARQALEAAARAAAQQAQAATRGAGTQMGGSPMMGGRGASASEKDDHHKSAAYLRAKHIEEEGLGEPHQYAPKVVDEKSVASFLNLDTADTKPDSKPEKK